MGLFAKLREGLTKTRDSLMGRVDTLVKETRKIDEDFYEELEDILLMSDCGMKATTAIMDELRRRVSENKVKDADTAKQMLKDIMIEQMDIPRPPLRWPMVMLVVGVNGAGKRPPSASSPCASRTLAAGLSSARRILSVRRRLTS